MLEEAKVEEETGQEESDKVEIRIGSPEELSSVRKRQYFIC